MSQHVITPLQYTNSYYSNERAGKELSENFFFFASRTLWC